MKVAGISLASLCVASLVCLAVFAARAAAADPSLLSKATPEEKELYAAAKAAALAEAKAKPLELNKTNEAYFWRVSARLRPLLKAHAYSKEPELLEAFVPMMKQVLSQRYVHPTRPEWSGWFEYDAGSDVNFRHLALIDHDTILYYVPVLLFVQEVRADPALKAKYGELAEAWLKDVEASIRSWDKRGCWHDMGEKGGWYTNIEQYPDPNTGEIRKLEVLGAGGFVPYNKVHALSEALNLAYLITGDEWYRTRMEKCAKFFRARWRVDEKHAEWNYRDHAFPGDYESGVVGQGRTKTGAFVHYKGGYYALDVEGVVRCWDLGLVYTKADIEKLIQTNLQFMFMGDANAPKFRSINGRYAETGAQPPKGLLWTALAHFDPNVRELWKTQLEISRKAKSWMWWGGAIEFLLETSKPVSWDARHAKPAGRPRPVAA